MAGEDEVVLNVTLTTFFAAWLECSLIVSSIVSGGCWVPPWSVCKSLDSHGAGVLHGCMTESCDTGG